MNDWEEQMFDVKRKGNCSECVKREENPKSVLSVRGGCYTCDIFLREDFINKFADRDQKGVKFDDNKPSFACLPPAGLNELGKIEALGKKKYGPNNYRNGLTSSRFIDAIFRHSIEFMDGKDHDAIDGNSHLASIAWNALACLQAIEDHPELDDRYRK